MAYIAQTQDEEEEKKKASGAIGGEAEASATPGQSGAMTPQPYTQTGFASAKNILDKNKDAANQYDYTQPFQQDLEKSRSETESGFGKFKDMLGGQVSSQKVGDNDLAEAIQKGSGAGSFQKLVTALHPSQVNAKFDPSRTSYNANDVASLNTSAGLQAALANQAQKQGVQNYSQGMGSLDAAIYGNQAGTRQKVADLSKQYADYDKQREDYAKQANEAVEKSNKELADQAEGIKGRLNEQATKLQTDYSKGGAGYLQQASAARAPVEQQAAAEKKRYIDEVAKTLPESVRQAFIDKANQVDIKSAINEGGFGNTGYSQEGANSFNNIMALLGSGNRVNAGVGNAAFDKSALQKQIDAYKALAERDAQVKAGTEASLKPAKPEPAAPKVSQFSTKQDKDLAYQQQLAALFGTPTKKRY